VFAVDFPLDMDSPWVGIVARLLAVPVLVVINGLFVAAEFALVCLRKTQVEELVKQGIKGAAPVESALARLNRTIAATQLGITLTSIGLGWAGEPALASLVEPLFGDLPRTWGVVATHSAAVTIAFILITYWHVVFGELIPKNLALHTPVKAALWLARPLMIFAWLTRPLTLVMSGTANAIVRLCGYEPAMGEEMVHSVEELHLLIEDTEEAGILEPDQAEYVQNVFRLSDKTVGDCRVPRDKIACLELNSPPDKVMEAVRSGAHTRMPVYEGNLDKIVGIVNTKDLFYLFSLRGVVVLEDALYPPLFLKPEQDLGTALRLFRQSHRPMALVRDDDGKVLGLITLEDIVEEIVGDLEDEHDRPVRKLRLRRGRSLPKAAALPPAKPSGGAPARVS
jgi:CBS domain containing-hemolysin-like protein